MFESLKKKRPRAEVVDLGLIFGGEATILGRVSRIEVREGTIGLPVMVLSQYRRFCGKGKSKRISLCLLVKGRKERIQGQ